MHEVLVYRLGGLSLPVSNVVINKISSCRVKRSQISFKGRKCVTVTIPVAKKCSLFSVVYPNAFVVICQNTAGISLCY